MKIANETAGVQPERRALVELPKIEIHRHLEGTYPLVSLYQMAMKNKLDVPTDMESFVKTVQFPQDHEPDFLLFLSKFKKIWYKSIDDVSSIAYDSVKSFSEEHLHYIELRFNPLHFSELTNLDPRDVTRTIIQASDLAAEEIGMEIRYLLTFNRGVQSAEEMLQTYKELHDVDLSRVVGLDLAGDEINYPPELFISFFDQVKKDDRFRIDIHAGEVAPSKSMWTSIDQLHADRIGHGIAAIEDEEIQQVLTKRNIFLAQCITSNYQTGAWRSVATHPMKNLVEAGVPISIASDDPTIQNSDLADDYMKAAVNFGWSLDKLIELNIKSIDACFLTDEEKRSLLDSYKMAVKSFRRKMNLPPTSS